MAFVSFEFIAFIFLVILFYFIFPQKFRWFVLLIASYFFYWANSHWLILIMFGTTVITFVLGLKIERIITEGKKRLDEGAGILSASEKKDIRQETKKRAKQVLSFGIILLLSILVLLKYYDFFAANVNRVLLRTGKYIPIFHFLVPLGISFYTLQAIGYLVDITRGKINADKNLFQFMLFMSFFPQIVQGPIPRYGQLANQLYEGHSFDYSRFCDGIQLIIWGFYKKLMIADRIGRAVNVLFDGYNDYQGFILFLALVFYGLQIYCDFSGGIDISRGFSQIIGIQLENNFEQPYFACSIEEFWRRWHITLGSWMRDYVFYPLSLSGTFGKISRKTRKIFGNYVAKRLPSFMAMFVVYILVGWWHGTEFKYIAYGLWNGFFIMAGILLTDFYARLRSFCHINENTFTWKVFKMIRTSIIVSIGRVFSRSVSFKNAIRFLGKMKIDWWRITCLTDKTLKNLKLTDSDWTLLILSVMILLAVGILHENKIEIRKAIARQHIVVRWLFYSAAIIAILVFGIWGPEYDDTVFIYEGF